MSMSPAEGLVYEFFPAELLCVSYTGQEPDAGDWDGYFALLSARTADRMRFVVYVDGPAPSRAIQARISDAARDRPWRVVLLSSSMALRFVVSVFSFVNRTIRFFPPEELRAALDHLECSAREVLLVERALARFRGASLTE